MNILAIDIGTHCGIAYNAGPDFSCETWDLATDKELKIAKHNRLDRRSDIRVHRLFGGLVHLHASHKFDIVIFEDVQFSSYTLQTQLWSSLRAAVWLAFPPSSGVNVECVPVATLKKFATGHGGATKGAMALFLRMQHPEQFNPLLDDNGIDAAWLWNWAKFNLTRGTKKMKV